jgi:MFS family permease
MDRKWWTLNAVSVATFMLLLDITGVNVALPSIREDLGARFTDLEWVVDAYALTLAALVLTAGSLADRLGRRLIFGAGLAVFTVASLLRAGAGRHVAQPRARPSRRRRRGDVRRLAGADRGRFQARP